MKGTFRSLRIPNYRLWAAGALVSNVGSWMQRTAQDWIILTQLAPHNATAVGISLGLQFGPHILLMPITGPLADRFNRRKILIATQSAMGVLALALGVLVLTGVVQLWHMFVFAFLLGCVSAFDAPARQTFVGELVDDDHISNAVGLNSSSINGARMVGPAFAGILIAVVGAGWVFVINAASFIAVIASLLRLRLDQLYVREHAVKARSGIIDGFRYVAKRPDLITILVMTFLVGTFAISFTITTVSMAVKVFDTTSFQFGLLTSAMATGSVTGALLSARRERPRMEFLAFAAFMMGITWSTAAVMPQYWMYAIALLFVGMCAQSFNTTANSAMQLWTDVPMRGRMMALFLGIMLGGQPIGGPLLGHITDVFGARQAVGVSAVAAFVAALVALYYLMKHRRLRVRIIDGRLQVTSDPPVEGPTLA